MSKMKKSRKLIESMAKFYDEYQKSETSFNIIDNILMQANLMHIGAVSKLEENPNLTNLNSSIVTASLVVVLTKIEFDNLPKNETYKLLTIFASTILSILNNPETSLSDFQKIDEFKEIMKKIKPINME